MTNSVNSGHKRSWDSTDQDHDPYKRRRGDDQAQPKDWRDVHLKSPNRKIPPPVSVERRNGENSRRRDEYRRSSRDRERDRGKRDDRDRDRDRDRGKSYRDDRRRSRSRSPSSRRTYHLPQRHQPPAGRESEEKEEGE